MGKKKGKSKAKARKVTQPPPPPPKPPIGDTLRKLAEILANNRKAAAGQPAGQPAVPTAVPTAPPKPSLVQTLTKPPENMVEHLERIGAAHLARIKEVMFGEEPTECLVIPWDALQAAEYEYLASGQWKSTSQADIMMDRYNGGQE